MSTTVASAGCPLTTTVQAPGSSIVGSAACVAYGYPLPKNDRTFNNRSQPLGKQHTLSGRFHSSNGVLSKDMIGSPHGDVVHTLHVGLTGETFGDLGHLTTAIGAIKLNEPSNCRKGLKFGRRMRGIDKNAQNNSHRSSSTSDEILYSLMPEEPRIDFGPSFYEEVMEALAQRIPHHSALKSKYSDFVSSNECDFSDSESSSINRDDFSETNSDMSHADPHPEGHGLVVAEDGSSNQYACKTVDESNFEAATTKLQGSYGDVGNQGNHLSGCRFYRVASPIIPTKRLAAEHQTLKQSTNDGQFCESTEHAATSRPDSKWNRACKLPVNGTLLRTLGVSAGSQDVYDAQASQSASNTPGLNRKAEETKHSLRCRISAPVQLISDSRLGKGFANTSLTHQHITLSVAPPLPNLASLGSKLTSAENVNKQLTQHKSSTRDVTGTLSNSSDD